MKLAGTMRLPFIIATPACVVLGIATAVSAGIVPLWWEIALVMLGAMSAHVAVNVLNEYQDNKSGLDATTTRTPFSGGSGTLQKHPELAPSALTLGITAAVLTTAIGLYFVVAGNLLLLVVGLVGVLTVVFYTPWIAQRPFLCLVSPGIGFGICMVIGTHIALGAPFSVPMATASLIPFFLVSNLLLINQFPDVEADSAVGRRNIIIAFGRKFGGAVYVSFLGLCYLSIVVSVILRVFPALSLIGLATLPLAFITSRGVLTHARDIEKLAPALGFNVILVLLTPTFTAVGILLG